ncbi:MAG: ketoacyl-ACP synthase III [Bacteroidetes bacterium]|nr:ketoacyl-ACP synthase III [Bacteroidota bacterium]
MKDNNGIGIIGTGHYLPSKIQSNEELCTIIPDLTTEWILEKTGIKRRFHLADGETASSIAIQASLNAIENSKITNLNDINLVIVASFSQEYLFPPMSAKIHSQLGLSKDCQILDVNTNCVGLVTALTIASERMLFDLSIKNALIVGVEVLSKYTNPKDKDTAVFFSDGASAVILGKVEKNLGYQNSKFMTDSSTYESVRMRGGGSLFPIGEKTDDVKVLFAEQNGLATWKQAITNFPVVIQRLLEKQSMNLNDIDFFIFHQANGFLIDYLMKKMKVPLNKTYTNVEEIGNTGSASIGIALSEAFSKGLIKKDSNLLIAGIGAGFNFGACLFKI